MCLVDPNNKGDTDWGVQLSLAPTLHSVVATLCGCALSSSSHPLFPSPACLLPSLLGYLVLSPCVSCCSPHPSPIMVQATWRAHSKKFGADSRHWSVALRMHSALRHGTHVERSPGRGGERSPGYLLPPLVLSRVRCCRRTCQCFPLHANAGDSY